VIYLYSAYTTELYNNWRTCSNTSFSQRSDHEAKNMADFDVCWRYFHDNWSEVPTQLPLTNRDPELQSLPTWASVFANSQRESIHHATLWVNWETRVSQDKCQIMVFQWWDNSGINKNILYAATLSTKMMMGKQNNVTQLQTRDTRTIGAIFRLNGITIKSGQYTR
jgi:hypothetical protein